MSIYSIDNLLESSYYYDEYETLSNGIYINEACTTLLAETAYNEQIMKGFLENVDLGFQLLSENAVTDLLKKIWGGIIGFIQKVIEKIKELFSKFADWFRGKKGKESKGGGSSSSSSSSKSSEPARIGTSRGSYMALPDKGERRETLPNGGDKSLPGPKRRREANTHTRGTSVINMSGPVEEPSKPKAAPKAQPAKGEIKQVNLKLHNFDSLEPLKQVKIDTSGMRKVITYTADMFRHKEKIEKEMYDHVSKKNASVSGALQNSLDALENKYTAAQNDIHKQLRSSKSLEIVCDEGVKGFPTYSNKDNVCSVEDLKRVANGRKPFAYNEKDINNVSNLAQQELRNLIESIKLAEKESVKTVSQFTGTSSGDLNIKQGYYYTDVAKAGTPGYHADDHFKINPAYKANVQTISGEKIQQYISSATKLAVTGLNASITDISHSCANIISVYKTAEEEYNSAVAKLSQLGL